MHRRGLEPLTTWFEARYSIRLSYRCARIGSIVAKGVDLKGNLPQNRPSYILIKFLVSQNISKIEGIVLQSLPFKEYDQILTLFTPRGILKLYAKGKKQYNPLLSPLTQAEYLFIPGRNELHRFYEGSMISQNLKIRDTYENLESAFFLVDALLRSQWPGKSDPQLYYLFRLFLQQIPESHHPQSLIIAFLIKIMKQEGILQTQSICSVCEKMGSYRYAGESFCTTHATKEACLFSLEEETLLLKIAACLSMQQLSSERAEPLFLEKVKKLFKQCF